MGGHSSKRPRGRKLTSSSASLTVPSVCDKESFIIPLHPTKAEADEVIQEKDDQFSFERMEKVFMEHSLIGKDKDFILTRSTTKNAMTAFDMLRRHMKHICSELQNETLKFPETLVARFEANPEPQFAVKEMIIVHLATVIYTHIKILTFFREGLEDVAINFLQQVAVSHALKWIQATDFKILDMYLVHYLVLNQLISDECIDFTITYLTIVNKHITKYYEAQTVANVTIMGLMGVGQQNDRYNKARENHRLMKKWRKFQEVIRSERAEIEDLWAKPVLEQIPAEEDEDTATIDTETLKERDFIMKHFVKKRRKSKDEGSISKMIANANAASNVNGDVKTPQKSPKPSMNKIENKT